MFVYVGGCVGKMWVHRHAHDVGCGYYENVGMHHVMLDRVCGCTDKQAVGCGYYENVSMYYVMLDRACGCTVRHRL